MARRIPDTRRNPDVFGEDVMSLAWEAVGVGVAAFGSDKIVGPIVTSIVPGAANGGTEGKLVDAVSTGLTGWLAGEIVGLVDSPIGRRIRRGGVLLGVAKVISAFIPGFSISASIPSPAGFPSLSGASLKQLAAPATINGTTATVETRLGVGTMGI